MEGKSERSWTREQLSAINERAKTLLVSAAAGSGKTATLTERIIRSLTDENSNVDISTLLVVTFTKAAANELSVKIRNALTEAVKNNPGNHNLQRQLYMLPTAKIRTIDAFCADILKNNTDLCGISPTYRLADKAEEELLARSILDGMIDGAFNGELSDIVSIEEFDRLSDCLTESRRAEELSEVFLYVYSKCESEVEGVRSLEKLIDNLSPESFSAVEDTLFGKIITDRVRECAEHCLKIYREYEHTFSSGSDAEKKYLSVVESDKEFLLSIKQSESYRQMRDAMLRESPFIALPKIMKDKSASMEDFADERASVKDEIIKTYRRYFLYSEDKWRELYSELYPLLSAFYRFLLHFDGIFFEEKKHRAMFSYADIARLAYSCLVRDGKTTELAESMKKEFSAIYIDEYQDVNPLQNSIFEAISREDNRFMVGDIKQSIYVFRKAKPEIFASMKKSFPPIEESRGASASVFMSKNFRSDRAVIDFVNRIFDKIFNLMGDSIGYTPEDRLTCGKVSDKGEPTYLTPKICVVDKSLGISEADVVAHKIKALLEEGRLDSGEPIKPSDIAILMRAPSGKDADYALALSKLGIPSKVSAREDFFLTPEVLLTLSVLNSIDNPRRDIYLAGYMCSPLAGFDADDLYEIKSFGEGETLYDRLLSYTEAHPDFEKGKAFLKTLDYYRTVSEGVGVDTLLYKIYHETGLFSLASRNNGRENLTILYDYARTYESGSFRGLYNFIHFINNITSKRDTEFDAKREGDNRDAVTIMSIHSSKGLEFPAVFVADSGRAFADRDAKMRLVYSDELGLAFRLRTPSGLVVADNPVRDVINLYNFGKSYEEEMRILYVALTRARERLYMVGKSSLDDVDKYVQRCKRKGERLDSYSVRRLSSYLEVALATTEGSRVYVEDFLGYLPEPTDAPENTEGGEEKITEKFDEELYERLVERFNYRYPAPFLKDLPRKLSVSKTTPTVLDGSEEETAYLAFAEEGENEAHTLPCSENKPGEKTEKRTLPAFMDAKSSEESKKRGIATHYLLQYADLKNLEENGALSELNRLTEGGYISVRDSERVRVDEIELFRKSELFYRMKRAKKIYRELRFTLPFPAEELTSEEDRKEAYRGKTVLVQGVIDCILEDEDGEYFLTDYKTDRLTDEELASEEKLRETMRRRHGLQLSYYKRAAEAIFGKAPRAVEVYSLQAGISVDVSLSGV